MGKKFVNFVESFTKGQPKVVQVGLFPENHPEDKVHSQQYRKS